MSSGAGDHVLSWWWVRHAPALGARDLIHGIDDAPADLSDRDATANLARILPTEALALTSSVARAIQTFDALREANSLLAIAQAEPALAEQDFGAWTGRTWDSLKSETKQFWKDPIDTPPAGGESYAAMCRRVQQAVLSNTRELRRGAVIAVAHAGPIRAALALALDLSPASSIRFEIDTLSITRIDAFVSRTTISWRVQGVNLTPRDFADASAP